MDRPRTALLLLVVSVASLTACGHRRHRVRGTNDVTATSAPVASTNSIALTGAAQSLTRVTSDNADEFGPALSPSGRTLLFTAMEGPSGSILGVDPSAGAGRMVYTPSNVSATYPSWLPDESGFVYVSNVGGAPAIVRAVTAGPNSAVSVVVDSHVAQTPAYPQVSPDGRHLAFNASMRGETTVIVSAVDGSKVTLLGAGEHPVWSADGKRLVFARPVGVAVQLFSVDAERGTGLTQITSDDVVHFWPSFSPDGRWILFQSNRGWQTVPGGSAASVSNLFAVHPDGTGLTQLTSGESRAQTPYWGKDGWIYFSADEDGNGRHNIWRFQPAGELAGGVALVTNPVPGGNGVTVTGAATVQGSVTVAPAPSVPSLRKP
ncbi:MAG TPA: hypothetical protein VF316_11265 [Polyangiaceae bacterium]